MERLGQDGSSESTDLEIGSEGYRDGLGWQAVGVQYDTLGIPQGATIASAKITFVVKAPGRTYEGASNDFKIIAEAIDDAAVLGLSDNNITSRARTREEVSWNPPYFQDETTVGTKVDTPDITALIQQVVNRPGWSENNRLTLMIFPQVYLDLADPSTGGTTPLQKLNVHAGPGDGAATLTVEYYLPGDLGVPVSSNGTIK
jgi:hypothetical protein